MNLDRAIEILILYKFIDKEAHNILENIHKIGKEG
jgi:hypothetical protein